MERNITLDHLKGIGIILVILGHIGDIPHSHDLIYSVHLPLFFIISGYLYHDGDKTFTQIIIKNFKAYVVPYLITCFGLLLAWLLKEIFGLDNNYSFKGEIISYFWGKSTMNVPYPNALFADMQSIGAIWFLLALFWAEIFCWICKRSKWPLLLVVLLFNIGVISFRYIYLPFSIQMGLSAALFLYIGNFLKKLMTICNLTSIPIRILFGIICCLIWLISVKYGGVNMAVCQYGPYCINVIGSTSGVILMYMIMHMVEKYLSFELLRIIGSVSLLILCIHLFDLNVLNLSYLTNMIVNILRIGTRFHLICYLFFLGLIYAVYTSIAIWVCKKDKRLNAVFKLNYCIS